MKPTAEQDNALQLFRKGESMVIEAGAGTGKTSTLVLLGSDFNDDRRGQYIAFNKSIVTEAKSKMPGHVTCSTAHSLAFRAHGVHYSHRLGNSGRMRSSEIANELDMGPIGLQYQGKSKLLSREFLASHVMRAIQIFCQSDDLEPGVHHFPYVEGIDEPTSEGKRTFKKNNALSQRMLPYTHKVWADLLSKEGRLPYKHDHYLKAWHLSGPKIMADYILFDEAQDANPVLEAIVTAQDHAQLVFVGDSQQAIYGWRGAVNALERINAEHRAFLTMSFRFGQPIADAANKLLGRLNADIRLTGNPEITSSVGILHDSDCLLTRTNAMAVGNLLRLQAEGKRAHLIGGADEVAKFVRAAEKLQRGERVSHPELACFESWFEVEEYVSNDPQGDELKMMVDLIDEFGVQRILYGLQRMPREQDAQVVISTAHKAKGREWPRVRLAGDFQIEGPKVTAAEIRLAYVAVTRARNILDDGGLLNGFRQSAVSA